MTFPLTPAAPFTASVSTISATTANAWRTYIARSLDTVDGGAYANTTAITWDAGSAGWTFNGPLTVGATATFVMTAGGTVTLAADATVSSGGGWDFEGGSLCRFRGTAGGATLQVDDNAIVTCAGDVTWSSASHCTFETGSTLTVASGAVATFNLGGASAAGVTFIGANGSAVWNGASTATWQTGSFATWQSGSTTTVSSGTFVAWTIGGGGNAGTLTVGAAGTVTYQASSNIVHDASSIDTYAASSSVVDGSTKTRSGPTTKSGTEAYVRQRIMVVADPPPTDIDVKDADIIEFNTLTLDDSVALTSLGASDYVRFAIYVADVVGILTITGEGELGPGTLLSVASHGGPKYYDMYWNGSKFRFISQP